MSATEAAKDSVESGVVVEQSIVEQIDEAMQVLRELLDTIEQLTAALDEVERRD